MWERACSRKRWVSLQWCRLTLSHRGQAPSHRGLAARLISKPGTSPNVGGGLAPDGGGSACRGVG
ncbi:hypothetical protein DYL61_06820 [Pseudomonas nabeulensis]|uniref:Uncharacterized protein n=1 Tax=Pseudomonas nabeulensis TaxID=2293833 RepID=A0A4Z0B739_9PSED|nr:hypothetical protein DYL61_06820 [Pseudomonas nabeulensis]